MRKPLLFSSFIIKIVAIITMTLDHIGIFLIADINASYQVVQISNIFRGIGRLSLPLFIFLIVEGVLHTKSFKKYLLRLAIIAIPISIFIACYTYINIPNKNNQLTGMGNIFIDLILTALTVYILDKKKGYGKFFILLPIAVSICSFVVKCYETASTNAVWWFPTFLYLQYDWISIALGIGFYYAKKLADSYIKNLSAEQNLDRYVFDSNGTTLLASNLIAVFFLIIVICIQFAAGKLWSAGAFWDINVQPVAILSGIFILMYNGKLGYHSKWFKWTTYAYYPLHLIILYIIFMVI